MTRDDQPEQVTRTSDSAAQGPDSASPKPTRLRVRALFKRVLPRYVVEEIQRYRKFKPQERTLYLKLKLKKKFQRSCSLPVEARTFLFLCFGNIMRSPMCEALMKRALADKSELSIRIASAGLNAKPGTPAHPWALGAAQDLGISLVEHRAQLATAGLIEAADVIFVMDYENLVQLHSRYEVPKRKVFLLGEFARPRRLQIHDPYYTDEQGTRQCYTLLKKCVDNIVEIVAPARAPVQALSALAQGSDQETRNTSECGSSKVRSR